MPPVDNTLLLLNASANVWRAMEEFQWQLCRAVRQRGGEVAIVFASPPPPAVRERFEAAGATVYALAYRRRREFFAGLGRIIREHRIRLVYIRFFRLNHFVSWLVRVRGVKAIVYTDAEGGVPKAKGMRRMLKRGRTQLTTKPNARIIAISQFVKERLIESGASAKKIVVIYNGVDLARFAQSPDKRRWLAQKYDVHDDELVLVTVARLDHIKRIDVLLEACALLRKRGLAFRYFVVGPEQAAANELMQLCRRLELDPYVKWIGQSKEPERYMQACDLFLLATEGEAFGNVLVEAMACGAPVVGSRSGAIPEIVEEGRSGLLAEAGNPESFADRIEVLADPALRQQYSRAAIARAQQFASARAVEKTVELLQSLGKR